MNTPTKNSATQDVSPPSNIAAGGSAGKVSSATDATGIFSCDHCDHETPVKAELAGKKAVCPKCGKVGRIGAHVPSTRPATPQSPAAAAARLAAATAQAPAPRRRPEPTTRCPFCREEILAVARKCKHCGEFLDKTEDIRQRGEMFSSSQHHGDSGPRPLPGWVVPAVAAVGLIVLAGGGWYMLKGGSTATPTTAPKVAAVAAPAFESTATSVQNALEGTTAKDTAGATTKFLPAEGGAWKSTVRGGEGSKAHRATLEAPYHTTAADAKAAGSRGVLVVEFTSSGGAWQFQSVSRQPLAVIVGGKEKEVPEDDRQTLRLLDNDYVVAHVKTVGLKMKPAAVNNDD